MHTLNDRRTQVVHARNDRRTQSYTPTLCYWFTWRLTPGFLRLTAEHNATQAASSNGSGGQKRKATGDPQADEKAAQRQRQQAEVRT